MRIGCSGEAKPNSGIGVVQQHLYRYLAAAGHDLVLGTPRNVGTSPAAKMRGLARGWQPAHGSVDVYLSVVPPVPFRVKAPLLTVVHDLRWLRTRSRLGARYRGWDLHRAVKRSEALLCITENTRRELLTFDPHASGKATVQWLGPGQIPENSFKDNQSGFVMLVGGAPHKRNELAAEALALAYPPWIRGVIGVGISDHVRATLSPVFPCEWVADISGTEMIRLYQRAQFFIMLGTDEGFGLPFIEALTTGCQVVATNHPLAQEVLGTAAVLIEGGDAAAIADQLHTAPAVPAEMRRWRAEKFSWTAFCMACEEQLAKLAAG